MFNRFNAGRIGFALAFIALMCGAFALYHHYAKPKLGYILVQDVYNGFELKKELQKKYEETAGARQRLLDSLGHELQMIAGKIESDKGKDERMLTLFNSRRDEYVQRRESMAQDNQNLTAQYDKEILTQLNQYVKEYGAEHGYKYIFGSDGNGSLMYADEAENITAAVTEFINQRYRGEK